MDSFHAYIYVCFESNDLDPLAIDDATACLAYIVAICSQKPADALKRRLEKLTNTIIEFRVTSEYFEPSVSAVCVQGCPCNTIMQQLRDFPAAQTAPPAAENVVARIQYCTELATYIEDLYSLLVGPSVEVQYVISVKSLEGAELTGSFGD